MLAAVAGCPSNQTIDPTRNAAMLADEFDAPTLCGRA